MENYKNKLFIILLSLMLITSFLPDVKCVFISDGFFFKVIPLLFDISIVVMIFFKFNWVIHTMILWATWQIIVSLLFLFGIIFVMIASESSKFPMDWVVIQVIFGLIKIVGLSYFLLNLKKI